MYVLVLLLVFALASPMPSAAQQKREGAGIPDRLQEYHERATKAAEVLTEIMAIPEQSIPEELMARAHAIAVIPNVVKGAFGIGGRWGKGLVSQRSEDGRWSPPSFIQIGGGSIGFQIGAEATDLVLVFTNEEGVESLLDGKVTLGADASVAAGPVGRTAQIGTDVLMESPIFAYSRSKGLFAGIALDGAAITIDDSANRKVYGRSVGAEEILLRRRVGINAVVTPFVRALAKVSPPHVHRRTTQ